MRGFLHQGELNPMYEFDTNEFPLAYLLTFRAYGTWLHGDERYSVDRITHRYGAPMIEPNQRLEKADSQHMTHAAVTFDATHRSIIEEAIREVCAFRGYELLAINIRTNHVHVVVAALCKPELLMNSFKSYATRHLRKSTILEDTVKPWSRHGSTRYLWKERHVEIAIDYVVNGQGDELPNF